MSFWCIYGLCLGGSWYFWLFASGFVLVCLLVCVLVVFGDWFFRFYDDFSCCQIAEG